jgi:hypothetical protein
MLITKNSETGALSFNVYRKPTHTDRYLDFDSYNPMSHKRSVIKSLFDRSTKICDPIDKEQEDSYVKNVLVKNSYPKKLIEKIHRQSNNRNHSVNNNQERVSRISASYIKGSTEQINRILKPYSIQLATKPSKTLKSMLCHLKDKREKLDKKNIIYEIPCEDCTSSYIGETGRQLKKRVGEHQNTIGKYRQYPNSQVSQHQHETGHTIDFENIKILDNNKYEKNRRFLEGVYTLKSDNAYNRAQTIPQVYIPVLRKNV